MLLTSRMLPYLFSDDREFLLLFHFSIFEFLQIWGNHRTGYKSIWARFRTTNNVRDDTVRHRVQDDITLQTVGRLTRRRLV